MRRDGASRRGRAIGDRPTLGSNGIVHVHRIATSWLIYSLCAGQNRKSDQALRTRFAASQRGVRWIHVAGDAVAGRRESWRRCAMLFARKREKRRQFRQQFEALEGRNLLTTFHAANSAELAADLAAVANSSGPNTIVLAAKTYDIRNQFLIQNSHDLTIVGTPNRANGTQLLVSTQNRIFDIEGGSVTISGVTLAGGGSVDQGGAIYANNADVTLESDEILANTARQAGGGVFTIGGTLNVRNTTFGGNSAVATANNAGGGIAAFGTNVNIAASRINNNSVSGNPTGPVTTANTGGGIFVQNGTLNITNSAITDNSVSSVTAGDNAASTGGGVSTVNTTVTVNKANIARNVLSTVARVSTPSWGSAFSTVGGSLTISNATFTDNGPGGPYLINHPGATVTIRNSTIEGQSITGVLPPESDGA
jgi:hypothetical protein